MEFLHRGWAFLLATVISLGASSLSGEMPGAESGEKGTQQVDEVSELAKGNKIVIHYHRFDGDYEQAGLWTWDGRSEKDPDMQEVLFSGETDFGVYFVLDPSDFGSDDSEADRVGFIPRLRRDWNQKDGGDRYWNPAMGREVWLIGNNPQVFTERPDISPKISAAYIDSHNQLTLRLSHPIPVVNVHSESFIVKHSDGGIIPLKGAEPQRPNYDGTTNFVSITTDP